ncbi:MAG: phosphoglycerate mutase, partial [Planctomycetia bacterium]|nr:phosphoglycerate mutase [Planctomycetia bacterium]
VAVSPVKEHRACMVLRGPNLSDALHDTDPQRLGVPPLEVVGLDQEPATIQSIKIVTDVLEQIKAILADEPRANTILARGFARYRKFPTFKERFGLRALAVASYPMYRGVAKLVGMELAPLTHSLAEGVAELRRRWDEFDYFFLHFKDPDKMGEDGNFAGKTQAIEEADAAMPELMALGPDVLVVTADHSTPSVLAVHSWHPVPVLLVAKTVRRDAVTLFDEVSCIGGGLGRQPTTNILTLMLAHAGRLTKFGA